MENLDILKIVKNTKDFDQALAEGKLAVVIGMEGLSGIGNRVNLINALYLLGVRHMSLTWNEENPLATGVRGNPNRGLTEKGIQAVKLMEKLGIIIDLAHANDKTFWDVYENTTGPIVNSHSNSRALCNVPRNISDEQDIHHLANHLDHMVEIAGIEHVSFGFDFFHYLKTDTIDSFVEDVNIGTKGFETIERIPDFIDILYSRGYTKEDIEKISYKNYYRLMEEVLGQ